MAAVDLFSLNSLRDCTSQARVCSCNKSYVGHTPNTAFGSNSDNVTSHYDLGKKVKSVNVSHRSLDSKIRAANTGNLGSRGGHTHFSHGFNSHTLTLVSYSRSLSGRTAPHQFHPAISNRFAVLEVDQDDHSQLCDQLNDKPFSSGGASASVQTDRARVQTPVQMDTKGLSLDTMVSDNLDLSQTFS